MSAVTTIVTATVTQSLLHLAMFARISCSLLFRSISLIKLSFKVPAAFSIYLCRSAISPAISCGLCIAQCEFQCELHCELPCELDCELCNCSQSERLWLFIRFELRIWNSQNLALLMIKLISVNFENFNLKVKQNTLKSLWLLTASISLRSSYWLSQWTLQCKALIARFSQAFVACKIL